MRPNMSDEKKTRDSPTFVIASAEALPSGDATKRRPYKKYVIIAVSAILAAAIILTAILVGMYLFTEAQREMIKFSYNRDQNNKEEVTSDSNSNIVQYHDTSDTYEMWVVDDFNRDIQVMKIKSASGTNCYVAPLNRTMALDPSKVSSPSDLDATKRNTTYSVTYRSANTPISDTSFLCKTARETCKGISTYWVYPSCSIPKDVSEGRYKRGGCCSSWLRWWIFRVQICLCWV